MAEYKCDGKCGETITSEDMSITPDGKFLCDCCYEKYLLKSNLKRNKMAEKDTLPDHGNFAPVDVIANGYEWECSVCNRLNLENEYRELYTCSRCGESFHTNPPEHAVG